MNHCAAELAADAVIPEHLADLMAHVAKNLVAHATWVGTVTLEARAEHDALLAVADEYGAIAAAALRAAGRCVPLPPRRTTRPRSSAARSARGCAERSYFRRSWRNACRVEPLVARLSRETHAYLWFSGD